MAKKKWAVRVVYFANRPEGEAKYHTTSLLVEQLRYMGIARVLSLQDDGMDSERMVVEFYCPNKGLDSEIWARQNADRMSTFGFNAVAAPVWGEREWVQQ